MALAPTYNPKEFEDNIYKQWQEIGVGSPEVQLQIQNSKFKTEETKPEIVFATTNKHKIKIFHKAFKLGGLDKYFELKTLADFPEIKFPVIEEDTGSFAGDALKKASEYTKILNLPVISGDRGIHIDGTNWPGTDSKKVLFGDDDYWDSLSVEERKTFHYKNVDAVLAKIQSAERLVETVNAYAIVLPNGQNFVEEVVTKGKANSEKVIGHEDSFSMFFIPDDLGHVLNEFESYDEVIDYWAKSIAKIPEGLVKFLKNSVWGNPPRQTSSATPQEGNSSPSQFQTNQPDGHSNTLNLERSSKSQSSNNEEMTTKYLIFDFDGVLGDTLDEVVKINIDFYGFKDYEESFNNLQNYYNYPSQHTKEKTLDEVAKWKDLFSYTGKKLLESNFPLFQDFIEEIKKLKNTKLAVVSSGTRNYIEDSLKNSGLEFTHILGFEEHHSKEVKIAQICLNWEVLPSQIYYFTDTKTDVWELENYLDKNKIIGCSWGYQGYEKLLEVLPLNQILKLPTDLNSVFSSELKPENNSTHTILMPPPNLSGDLHAGHAFGHYLQDTLTRVYRQKGQASLWYPGVDHAGIQLEGVIDKLVKKGEFDEVINQELENEKLENLDFIIANKDELPKWLKKNHRDLFIKLAWSKVNLWRDNQKKQCSILGDTPDYSRSLFTLDDKATKMVMAAFEQYWKDGLIYKGSYLINWSVGLQTALSDVAGEIEFLERKDPFVTFEYRIDYSGWGLKSLNNLVSEELIDKVKKYFIENPVIVSTVRPETIFGDVAIAINKGVFYKNLKSNFSDSEFNQICDDIIYEDDINLRFGIKSLVGGVKLILGDDNEVDPNFGTGALKITPASDQHDYDIFNKYIGGEFPKAVGRDGKLTEVCSEYAGLTVEQGRLAVIKTLAENGYIPVKNEELITKNDSNKILAEVAENIAGQGFDPKEHSYEEGIKRLKEIMGEAGQKLAIDWDYIHNVSICERSKTVIEPLISEEFFLSYEKEFEHTSLIQNSKFKIENENNEKQGAEIPLSLKGVAGDSQTGYAYSSHNEYVLLHGFTETSQTQPIFWFADQIAKANLTVKTLDLPNTLEPKEIEQVEYVLKNTNFSESSILIGHSLGGTVSLKVLEKLNTKIKALIIIAGVIEPNFKDKKRNFENTFDWNFDFSNIKNKADKIIVISDLNDPAVPIEQGRRLAEELNGELFEIEGKNPHFSGIGEQEILDIILDKTNKLDNLLYEKYDHQDGLEHKNKELSHAIIYNSKINKYLVFKEVSNPYAKYDLSLIGGKLDTGETSLQALKREFTEETGIDTSSITKIQSLGKSIYGFVFQPDNFNTTHTDNLFYLEVDSDKDGFSADKCITTWLTKEEILSQNISERDRMLFDYIHSINKVKLGTNNPINTYIFDLGNVVVIETRVKMKEYLAEKYNLIDGKDYVFNEVQKELKLLGLEDFNLDFWQAFSEKFSKFNIDTKHVYDIFLDILNNIDKRVIPQSVEVINKLRKEGKKVYYLSNTTAKIFEPFTKLSQELFDGGLASFELDIEKPRPEIYEAILRKYNIDPKKAVFIDDREDNLLAGEKFGLKGILFDYKSTDLQSEIDSLLAGKIKTNLKKLGLEGVGETKYFSEDYKERAINFLENIKDWCISRDLVWGHKIPVWYNLDLNPEKKFYSFEELENSEKLITNDEESGAEFEIGAEIPLSLKGVAGDSQTGYVSLNKVEITDNLPKWKSVIPTPNLKSKAKELRQPGNLSEVIFWNAVKNKQLGDFDFTRQKVIGNYIVDFFIESLGVVIEIDGESHNFKGEYDTKRDEFLKSLGLEVIHYSTLEIKNNLSEVLVILLSLLNSRKNTPSRLRPATPFEKGEFQNTTAQSEPEGEFKHIENATVNNKGEFQLANIPLPMKVQATKPTEPGNWVQEEKILDTWFSSCLWPLTTLNFYDHWKGQKVVIIHGSPETKKDYKISSRHWFPWLKVELEKLGAEVFIPEMPNSEEPDYDEWKKTLEALPVEIDDQTVLIGHSAGGAFLARYINETKTKIKQLVLVSASKSKSATNPRLNELLDFEIDLQTKNLDIPVVVITSKNEPEYRHQNAEEYAKIFNTEVIYFENYGHFTQGDMGKTDFPELLDLLSVNNDFEKFYSTQEIITAGDIFYTWIVRMTVLGKYFTGKIPFETVVITPTVRDEQGRKMSKSLGNGLDAVDTINKYSSDALRLAMLSGMIPNRNFRLGGAIADKMCEKYRNFGNKLWNVARFLESRE